MDSTSGDDNFISADALLQIQKLAEDEEQCFVIAYDDTIMSGLVLLLSNSNGNVVQLTLQIIKTLGKRSKLRHHIKHFMGMNEQLKLLLNHSDESIQDLASSVCNLLNYHDEKNHKHRTDQSLKPLRARSMLRGAGKTKTLVFHIKGMHDKEDMELCRNCILTVKGVISITFNSHTKRAILRAKPDLKAETVAKAVTKTMTMAVEQVIKNEQGEEEFISFKILNTSAMMDQENLPLPDYPSDEETAFGESQHNMARAGNVGDNQGHNAWGFVKKVGDFISNSFYW